MNYTRRFTAVVVLALGLSLGACGTHGPNPGAPNPTAPAAAPGADQGTRTVDTAFGPVGIPTQPRRAIALEGGIGPLLSAGVTPIATADGQFADSFLPSEYDKVKDLPIILGKEGPDLEKIAALKPDLMIGFVRGGKDADAPLSSEAKAQWSKLNAIAPTVLIRSNGSAETKEATLTMSEALGDGQQARAAKQAYDDKAAHIKNTYADVLAKHVFAPLDYYEEVNVYSPISWPGDTLTDAGAQLTSVSAGVTDQNATFLSAEQLGRVSDATVVLYEQTVDAKPGEGAAELQQLPTYAALPAVKAGHAYGLSYFFADRYETALKSLESLEATLKRLA